MISRKPRNRLNKRLGKVQNRTKRSWLRLKQSRPKLDEAWSVTRQGETMYSFWFQAMIHENKRLGSSLATHWWAYIICTSNAWVYMFTISFHPFPIQPLRLHTQRLFPGTAKTPPGPSSRATVTRWSQRPPYGRSPTSPADRWACAWRLFTTKMRMIL